MSSIPVLPTFNITTAIAELKEVSRYVSRWLDLERYVDDIGADDITPQSVLSWAYSKAYINDLQSIGIVINVDIEDLCQDFHTAELITALLKVTSEEYLTSAVTSPDMVAKLESMVHDIDVDNHVVVSMVEYLSEIYPNDESLSFIMQNIDLVSEDDEGTYGNYHLLNFLEEIEYRLSTQTPIYLHNGKVPDIVSYSKYISWRRRIAREAVNLMLEGRDVDSSITDAVKQELQVILDRYDMDKLQADVIHKYACMDIEGYPIDPSLKDMAEVLMDNHHKTNMHHIEYYIANQHVDITYAVLLGLLAHHYCPSMTNTHELYPSVSKHLNIEIASSRAACKDEVEDMIQVGIDHELFDSYQVTFLRTYADKLYKHMT